MSLNKTLLTLALGLALTACGPVDSSSRSSSINKISASTDFERSDVDDYTVRIYDRKYNVVCYKYVTRGIACVKL